MVDDITELEPRALWRRFNELRQIPRPSKKEDRARRWVLDLAAEKGLETQEDEGGNILVQVPASEGFEGAPKVLLQGHLDMVTVKEPDRDFDFDHDPIEIYIDGDRVQARGTTLGADNGIGVAAALALLDYEDLRHGPLGLVFTVEEEIGLKGAQRLDPQMLEGQFLLNLDTIDETEIVVSCAGAAGVKMAVPVHREVTGQDSPDAWRLAITGLTGGHSGGDIHRGRASGIQLMMELVEGILSSDSDACLLDFRGGIARNALPREAHALVRADGRRLGEAVEAARARFRRQFLETDPGLEITWEPVDEPEHRPWTRQSSTALLELLAAIPHGVITMSEDIPGLVQTSTNLALVGPEELEAGRAADRGSQDSLEETWEISNTSRGSDADDLARLVERLDNLGQQHGAQVRVLDSYPGWRLDPNSPLLAKAVEVYRRTFGRDPKVTGVHGGLECGVLGAKNPALDIVAFGADLRNAHAPTEQISISSVQRVFGEYLPALIEELAEATAT